MSWWTETSAIELELLLLTLVLCSFIGLERQFRQKSAGFRTHVLVGTGSAAFTLVSGFGFSKVLGLDVSLDPSRIAAQIVSGIGFLGAGLIFTRRDSVRGLTSAATVWVTAAVGMAAGSGLVSLAIGMTATHLLVMFVLGPVAAKLPTRDTNRVLRITYVDGEEFFDVCCRPPRRRGTAPSSSRPGASNSTWLNSTHASRAVAGYAP